jgi:diphthine-ammonia ligase
MLTLSAVEGEPAQKAVCSSSGGKDSMLALWHARDLNLRPATLLTMFDETGKRSRSHGVSRTLAGAQARALGLDLFAPSAGWKDYEKVFVEALNELRERGHEVAIFGDIDLEPHREWEARVCKQAGVNHCLPLWHRSRLELARESIALGFKSIVVCVDSRFLGDAYCGRLFDESFIRDLPPGVDACGENGEFHTFVYDGPSFNRPVEFVVKSRSEYVAPPEFGNQRYCFANLE